MDSLILAIVCSALVAVLLRVGGSRENSMYGRFTMNYFAAVVLAAAVSAPGGGIAAAPESVTVLLGVVQGALYLGCFVLMQSNIQRNGVILSSTFSKLGLIVPILLSVVLFQELPSALQTVGVVAALAAIILLQGKGETAAVSRAGLLFLLLVAGVTDSMAKVFEQMGPMEQSDLFLLCTFITALVLSLGMMLHQKERIGRWELIFGCLVGIPNYASGYFLLRALNDLPGVLVYPSYSAGTILLVSLAGVLFFGERQNCRQWCGMAVVLLALICLNL